MAYEIIFFDVTAQGPSNLTTETVDADEYFVDGTYTTFTNDTVKVRSLPTTSIHSIKKV